MATKLQISRLAGGYSETDVVNLERGESYLLELALEPFSGGSDNGTLYDVEVTTGTSAAAVSCTADSSTDTFTATAPDAAGFAIRARLVRADTLNRIASPRGFLAVRIASDGGHLKIS